MFTLRSTTALIGALATTGAMAVPLTARQSSDWTLESFTRSCDDSANTCNYSFGVNQNGGAPATQCAYTITGNGQSARIQPYDNVPCGQFSINMGYDPSGFVVVVPTDTSNSYRAFFGYTIAQLADGVAVSPDESQPASAAAIMRKRDAGWTVEGLARSCPANAPCHYTFGVNTGSSTEQCDISNGDATGSFYNVACSQGSRLVISWGFNAEHGYAVMTVVDSPTQMAAWFGFDDVNTKSNFNNVGPNPVKHL